MSDRYSVESVGQVVALYSPELDLHAAQETAHTQLMSILDDMGLTLDPVEVKILVEQSVSARFDIMAAMLVQVLTEIRGWDSSEADQELAALRDMLRLVKHHTDIRMLQLLQESDDENLEDE